MTFQSGIYQVQGNWIHFEPTDYEPKVYLGIAQAMPPSETWVVDMFTGSYIHAPRRPDRDELSAGAIAADRQRLARLHWTDGAGRARRPRQAVTGGQQPEPPGHWPGWRDDRSASGCLPDRPFTRFRVELPRAGRYSGLRHP